LARAVPPKRPCRFMRLRPTADRPPRVSMYLSNRSGHQPVSWVPQGAWLPHSSACPPFLVTQPTGCGTFLA
jgi:hypothetical protein